jgi:hypothetical protein
MTTATAPQPPLGDAADQAAAPIGFLPADRKVRRELMAAYCRTCDAEPGQECRTRVGPIERGHFHADRKVTARARLPKPPRRRVSSPPPARLAERPTATRSRGPAEDDRTSHLPPERRPTSEWALGRNPAAATTAA